VIPISSVQAEAHHARTPPPVEKVRDGVWSVAYPFGDGIDDFTLGYIVEGDHGEVTLIDPGWYTADNLSRLTSALALMGRGLSDIGLIAVTHLHVDHLGSAEQLRRLSGARLALHASEAAALQNSDADGIRRDAVISSWGAPAEYEESLRRSWGSGRVFEPATVDVLLHDGETLPGTGRRLEVVHTPGHTTGHVCLLDRADGLIFTGDHVLPEQNPGIGLGGSTATNPVTDYLDSLDRASSFDAGVASGAALEVCPGHGYRFMGLGVRCAELSEHRLHRSDDAAAALDALTHPSVWNVAEAMPWRGGLRSMTGYRLGSALAQTEWHVDALHRSTELGEGWGPVTRA
jgi:glyoxylase-like metal-dependent hydrolase (beta-lactamase superfamily II)